MSSLVVASTAWCVVHLLGAGAAMRAAGDRGVPGAWLAWAYALGAAAVTGAQEDHYGPASSSVLLLATSALGLSDLRFSCGALLWNAFAAVSTLGCPMRVALAAHPVLVLLSGCAPPLARLLMWLLCAVLPELLPVREYGPPGARDVAALACLAAATQTHVEAIALQMGAYYRRRPPSLEAVAAARWIVAHHRDLAWAAAHWQCAGADGGHTLADVLLLGFASRSVAESGAHVATCCAPMLPMAMLCRRTRARAARVCSRLSAALSLRGAELCADGSSPFDVLAAWHPRRPEPSAACLLFVMSAMPEGGAPRLPWPWWRLEARWRGAAPAGRRADRVPASLRATLAEYLRAAAAELGPSGAAHSMEEDELQQLRVSVMAEPSPARLERLMRAELAPRARAPVAPPVTVAVAPPPRSRPPPIEEEPRHCVRHAGAEAKLALTCSGCGVRLLCSRCVKAMRSGVLEWPLVPGVTQCRAEDSGCRGVYVALEAA